MTPLAHVLSAKQTRVRNPFERIASLLSEDTTEEVPSAVSERRYSVDQSSAPLEEMVPSRAEYAETSATEIDEIDEISILRAANEDLITKLKILRDLQRNNVAHKRLSRYAGAFLLFFSFTFLARVLLQTTIVEPLWNDVGLFLSFGFFAMALAMGRDWKNLLNKNI